MNETQKSLIGSLISNLLWIAGLFGAVTALWQFYEFVVFRDARGALDAQGGGHNLWFAIGATVLTCACTCAIIFRRINRAEEFHITS